MYTAFGLNIESEIELPELLTSEGPGRHNNYAGQRS